MAETTPTSGTASTVVADAPFPEVTRDQWRSAVDRAIRGADYERTLVTTTLDGLRIEPLYTAADIRTEDDEAGFPGFTPLLRGHDPAPARDGRWDVRTQIDHPDPAGANAQALSDVAGGATSLDLLVDADGSQRGVSCRTAVDLSRILVDVPLDRVAVWLRAGAHAGVAAKWLFDVWDARDLDPARTTGGLGLDPLGTLARTGVLTQGLERTMAGATDLAARTSAERPAVRTFRASGLVAADAGASEGQEVAFALAAATSYLRALVDAGVDTADAARQISFELFADVDVFATVAKVRALRHCWATVLDACGVRVDPLDEDAMSVDLVAGGRWLTRVDPWVNLLRGSAAALGAVVGGADSVIVASFDAADGRSGEQARRLARNTQHLLMAEAGVGRVMDPAGGSYYVESLTDALAEVAWLTFQRYEAAGGLAVALADGTVTAEVEATARARATQIATRRRPITGVSEFPLLGERRPDRPATTSPDTRPRLSHEGGATTVPALVERRLAEPFEALRFAAERAGSGGTGEPTVFLAALGSGAAVVARSTFAANLFGAGGIGLVGEGGAGDVESLAADFTASRTPVAVICGGDDAYPTLGVDAARALKAAGARYVYLAGRPGPDEGALREAGVDEFVYNGVDALDVLRRLHDRLEVHA